jgi:GNAT superfamily N-acetyltransferase
MRGSSGPLAIDPFSATEDDYSGYVALKQRVWTHEVVSVASQRESDSRTDGSQYSARLLARRGGAVIGAADVYSLPFSADAHRFGFMVIVDPEGRRRRVGTSLWRHITDDLELGAVTGWESAAWEGDPSGAAWLRHLGFELGSTHQMSELDLATVDTSGFAGAIDAVEAAGVDLVAFGEYVATTPDAAEALYELAIELSCDVPWYEQVAKPALAVWRAEFVDSDLILRDASTVAVSGGRLIGQSTLMRDHHDPGILRTGLTGVVREFRRRGIARAMKMRAIATAAAEARPPDGLRIQTGNASQNPMLQLNLRLGFVKQPAWQVFTRSV